MTLMYAMEIFMSPSETTDGDEAVVLFEKTASLAERRHVIGATDFALIFMMTVAICYENLNQSMQ